MPESGCWVAKDVAGARLSAIKEMALRAAKIEGALSLTWGLPSFRTPEPIRAAAAAALESDPEAGKYSLPAGLPELRALAAEAFHARSGRSLDPDSQVLVTAGNMEGVKVLLRSLLDPGDEVVVTDPCFSSHLLQIGLSGGRPLFLPLREEAGWRLEPERLDRIVTPRTKALLLVTPHNPTGVVFSRDSLQALGRFAAERDLLVILDDPYSPFVYDGPGGFADPLAVPELAERLAYLFTFSKAYAMSGWRVGFMALPPGLAGEVVKVHDATLICAPRISQIAATAAFANPALPPPEFRERLAARRDLICARLDRLPELFSYVRPEGAYYVFPRILKGGADSRAFSIRLLEEAGVVVTPGSAFGPAGESHVRMAYCVEETVIHGAFDRIEAWFKAGGGA